MQVRVPVIDPNHQFAAEAAGCGSQKDLMLGGVRVHGPDVGDLQGLLELAEFEDAGRALAGREIAVELNVDFQGFWIGIGEPFSRHLFMIGRATR
jgi:hypothetical protein